jgi:hypothetical protein
MLQARANHAYRSYVSKSITPVLAQRTHDPTTVRERVKRERTSALTAGVSCYDSTEAAHR